MFKELERTEKVADSIISQIRDAILSGELKPGDKIAAEKDLVEEFGVSKASVRESLRVLEAMGLVQIRKGVSGGIFVAEVDMRTTIHGILNFLHFQTVSTRDITMVRSLIEPTIAQIAAQARTDDDIQKLREISREHIVPSGSEDSMGITFHRYLARITKNPMLILIVDFVDGYLKSFKVKLNMDVAFYDHVQKAHEFIIECLVQKDQRAARIAMVNDLLEVDKYMSEKANTEPFDPASYQIGHHLCCLQLGPSSRAAIVEEGDPLLKEAGVLIRRVGSSNLYVVTHDNPQHNGFTDLDINYQP